MRLSPTIRAIAIGMAIGAAIRLYLASGSDALFWNPYWIPLTPLTRP